MTINDIAKEAGVSTATVSRVINKLSVSAEKRQRVEEAIQKLDYTPNVMARGLMNKSTGAVGVLTTSMSNPYSMEITEAVERWFRERGTMQFLGCTEGDQAQERRYLNDLVSRQVDGIIVIDPANENVESGFFRTAAGRIPLVLIHSIPTLTDISSVVIDQPLGMVRVMDHLFRLGHRDIAFLRGRYGFSYDIKERAWRESLVQAGATPSEERLVVVEDGNTEQAIAQVRDELVKRFQSGTVPTALFACNDLMAMGALEAASQVGLRVPDDLSVVGHDNTILALHGKLTSVDLKMRSLGLAAADLLAHLIEGTDTEPRRVMFVPDLVLRDTTAAPRSTP
jgi:DNA-binding LacI/PurR family transcriptional regulator